uniref:Uncharacterized protein n=1 Tax=Echinococcus granulosus TaxID=6210 RepID=A0A068WAL8_ECHGR|nr:hypothetical protein EgrG_000784950 [Echinococcus granulosus]
MPLPTLLRVSFFYTLSYAPGPLLYSIFTSSTALRLITKMSVKALVSTPKPSNFAILRKVM